MAGQAESPADEIAKLLEQCTSEEVMNILQAIEGPGDAAQPSVVSDASAQQAPAPVPPAAECAAPPPVPPPAAAPAPPLVPVAPAGPPPAKGRRPVPGRTAKKAADGSEEAAQEASGVITVDALMQILEDHSASVITEVQKILPGGGAIVPSGQAPTTETIDVGALAEALLERDREVERLEGRLAQLQATLAEKDRRAVELGGELDQAMREMRHRQLDLELQQLKLEERVRSNAELEMVQRNLASRVEEAELNARHAALDLDLSRTLSTPRGIRAQGALPWTLRKNRVLPAVGGSPAASAAAPPSS